MNHRISLSLSLHQGQRRFVERRLRPGITPSNSLVRVSLEMDVAVAAVTSPRSPGSPVTVPVMVIPHRDLGPRLLTLAAAVLLMRVKLLLSALLPVLMRLLEALVMRVLSGGMGKGMVSAAMLARALLGSAVLVSAVPARAQLVSDALVSAVLARALLVSAVLVRVLLVSAVLVSAVLVSAVLARALLVSTVLVCAVLVSAVLARVLVVVSTVLVSAVLARTLVVSAVLARALLLSAVLIMTWMMSAVLVSTVLARTLVVSDVLMRVADDLQQALVLQVWASGGPAGEGVAHGARSVVVRAAHSAHLAHPQSFRAILTESQLTGLQHHLHNNGFLSWVTASAIATVVFTTHT